MSVFRRDHNVLFIHVPKTAGSAMKQQGFLGGAGHKWALDYHDELIRILKLDIWDDIFKFAFVRNPWDRFVSAYFWLPLAKDGPDHFRDFVLGEFSEQGLDIPKMRREKSRLHHHFIPQHYFICDRDQSVMMDFVGRFEKIQKDWRAICGMIGVNYKELPIVNESNHLPYQEYYDRQTIDVIAEIYADDIELFGYEFE